MLEGSGVVVVVPAFDEELRIASVLRSIPSWVDRVIVVDDASRDATRAVAERVGDPRVEILSHDKNRGVGAAIVTGYRRALERTTAPNDAFAVMAGDGQMDPADLAALAHPVVCGAAGYVKGNRFSSVDAWRVIPIARRIGGEFFSHFTSRAIDVSIHDSQCGYTVIARGACASLDLSAIWPRYGYPNDLLAQLAARRIVIAEVPVRPVYGGEKSGLRAWHVARIAQLVGRAWLRRKFLTWSTSG